MKKSKIKLTVEVTVEHEGMPMKEQVRIAKSLVYRTSCGGAGGYGLYNAEIKSVRQKRR